MSRLESLDWMLGNVCGVCLGSWPSGVHAAEGFQYVGDFELLPAPDDFALHAAAGPAGSEAAARWLQRPERGAARRQQDSSVLGHLLPHLRLHNAASDLL